jgi:hypothetical protein
LLQHPTLGATRPTTRRNHVYETCVIHKKKKVTVSRTWVLFCWSCFGLFQLVSTYSLSHNTIESAETYRLSYLPNQPMTWVGEAGVSLSLSRFHVVSNQKRNVVSLKKKRNVVFTWAVRQ